MSRKVSLQVVLFSLLAGAFLYYAEASSQCDPHYFQCSNGECVYYTKVCDGSDDCGDNSEEHFCNTKNCDPSKFLCLNWNCIKSTWFCDGANDCVDYSDERFCNIHSSVPCPPGWYRCPTGTRCIPFLWMCNGRTECPEISEEVNCGITTAITPTSISVTSPTNTAVTSPTNTAVTSPTNTAVKSPEYTVLKSELKSWLLGSRKPGCRPDRWGPQVHRIAVALHLAENSTFGPGNSTGEEIRYELTMQLHRIGKDRRMSSQELALYIHALLVACMDPRDFYGDDLVGDLRRRVEEGGNYTNPFLILVLCNAGDDMTVRDVERVTAAYDSQHRLFWADSQALASMALSCISSSSGVPVDEHTLGDMLQDLKRRQFRNGTVDNFRTTALVTQALFIHESYKKDFDLDSAINVLTDGLKGSNSVLDFYYALPVLNRKSLLNVTSSHCRRKPVPEEEALQKVLDVNGETITVLLSVWMGDGMNAGRSWRLRMNVNSTIYNAIETVAKIDYRLKVKYNVVDDKPYVASLNGKGDDPELGMFWFIYLKSLSSDKDPKIVEESPVDIKLEPNEEIILWYKRGPWSGQSLMQKSVRSS